MRVYLFICLYVCPIFACSSLHQNLFNISICIARIFLLYLLNHQRALISQWRNKEWKRSEVNYSKLLKVRMEKEVYICRKQVTHYKWTNGTMDWCLARKLRRCFMLTEILSLDEQKLVPISQFPHLRKYFSRVEFASFTRCSAIIVENITKQMHYWQQFLHS